MWDLVSTDKPGETITELSTRAGKLRLRHVLLEENVRTGTEAYLKEHLIQESADYRTVAYILERLEYAPLYEKVHALQAELGEDAFVVPLLHRIPFQQVLLEYLGETPLFYALYDAPTELHKLLDQLDEQLTDILNRMEEFRFPYIEFPDNLTSSMTNPRLFRDFCLPYYQKYSEILARQGKKTGSHTDGNLKGLLGMLAESGLDVCESVSPYPLSGCTLEEIWSAWPDGPIIWGGIPSPILEAGMSEFDFRQWVERFFQVIGQAGEPGAAGGHCLPILGVVDLFMHHNSIERVRSIAQHVERFQL
jgi:uroporphyrinogen-III decarboxylase